MLAVVGIAFLAVVLSLCRASRDVGSDVGIHVPNFSVGTHVGGFVVIPEVVITSGDVTFDGSVERGFECFSALSFSRAVVACRNLSEEND